MPSVRYYNQSGPFWDFIADLENQGSNHPLFAVNDASGSEHERAGAFGAGFPFSWGFHQGPPPSAPAQGEEPTSTSEKVPDASPPQQTADGDDPAPPRSPSPGPHRHPHNHHGHKGHWARGGCHGRGRGGMPFGPRGAGRSWGRPWGGPGGFGAGGPFNLNALAELFNSQFLGGSQKQDGNANAANEDFKPLVDVFDTESGFVVHVSLPGAKKEDVAVSWDAEKSELSISGVIHRPGDEEFLKTLALDERQVGVFERKIRLGSRANPAQVDHEAIAAKLEDGILRIDIPKEDRDYVEVKKVDIE